MTVEQHAQDIITFWFDETPKSQRFRKDPELDRDIAARFRQVYARIVEDPDRWLRSAQACFAAILVLDQFARNMFRGQSQSFAADPIALTLAKAMIEHDWIDQLSAEERNFALMPFMHSEDASIHAWALPYFETYADSETLEFEHKHKAIIDRFGRYPHRNAILGRTSTAEERDFLKQHPGF